MTRHIHLLAASCLLTAAAAGTTLPPSTTGDLVLKAERICCARCDSVEARRDPRTGMVFTHVRLSLLEDLKGNSPASSIELRIVGGEADGVRTIVAGMPRFRPGKESVLFLGRRNRAGFPVLVEARKGVLALEPDKTGQRRIHDRMSGLGELSGKRRVGIDEFRGAVRRILDEQKRRLEAAKKREASRNADREGK